MPVNVDVFVTRNLEECADRKRRRKGRLKKLKKNLNAKEGTEPGQTGGERNPVGRERSRLI
jgi:hypothetical protein